jgi:hypothetical protein
VDRLDRQSFEVLSLGTDSNLLSKQAFLKITRIQLQHYKQATVWDLKKTLSKKSARLSTPEILSYI